MKAIVQDRYGSPGVLEFRDIATPEPGDGEVLVRVRAAGVDPGVWHLTTGRPYLLRAMGFGLRGPKSRVRGFDVAGVVESVGAKVTRFRPGDEVFGMASGSFAEYTAAAESRLTFKPRNLTFEEASVVAVSGYTALQALRDKGRVQAGQRVLIIGAAGGVGSYAVQLAKMFGARVTAVCGTAKTEVVKSLGADEVIDYTREDFTDGSRVFDLILDTAGNRPLGRLRRALASRGTLVIVGGAGEGRWFGGVDRVPRAMVLSMFVGERLCGVMSAERPEDLELLREAAERGAISPLIDRTFPISEAIDAVEYVHKGHSRGKVVLTV